MLVAGLVGGQVTLCGDVARDVAREVANDDANDDASKGPSSLTPYYLRFSALLPRQPLAGS